MLVVSEIKDLIYTGKYNEAISLTSDVLESQDIDKELTIRLLNLYSGVAMKQGNLQLALEKSDRSFEIALEIDDGLLAIESLRSKIEVLLKMAKFDKLNIFLMNVQKFVKESDPETDLNFNYKNAVYLHLKGAIERYNGNFQLAVLSYQESLQFSDKLDDLEMMAITANHLGIAFDHLGDYDNSIFYYNQSLIAFEEIGDVNYVTGVSMNIGLLFYQMGKHKEALFHYNKSMEISKKLQNDFLYHMVKLNTGLLNIDLGKLNEALNQFTDCVEFFDKMGIDNALISTFMNMGIVYDLLWDFQNALDAYEQAAFISRRIKETILFPKIIYNMGLTYINTHNYKEALSNFEEVLKISKQLDNKFFRSQILYQLIVTSISLNERSKAEFYLQLFEEVKEYLENARIEYIYKLAKSIYLNSSDRIAHKVESQKLLEEIINTKDVDYETLMEAILILSEILVKEFEWTKSEAAIGELNTMLARLTSISTENPSHRVRVEVLILQSKTAFILQNMNMAIISLNKAEAIAEKESLDYLLNRVHDERVSLENNVRLMQEISEKASQLIELNKHMAENYIEYVKRRFKPLS
ncbi:MAG: tetratricopeptide repeat protein [Candidatus Heimdallarchaeota archaeon]|nr:tetratricopeptide repeat protein [Candidatus Heimdallarchaeota archaeon]